MHFLRNIIFYLIMFCFFSTICSAKNITLEEFIDLVKTNHPFLKKEDISPEIKQWEQFGLLGEKDWYIEGSPYYKYQKYVGESSFDPENMETYGLELAASKALWETGGRLSLSWMSRYADQELSETEIPGFESFVFSQENFYKNGLSATYSHPLFKNKKGILDKLNYKLADFSIKSAQFESVENKENFILKMGLKYFDWVLLNEELRIAADRIKLAGEQLEQTNEKRKSNLVDQVDVLRAQDELRIAKQNQVLIRSRWKGLQAELAILVQSDMIYSVVPRCDLSSRKKFLHFDDIVDEVVQNLRSVQTLNTIHQQLVHQLSGLQNSSLPNLNFNVTAGLYGGEVDFDDSLDMDKPEVLVALKFSYPWGNRKVHSEIEKVKLQMKKVLYEISSLKLDLTAEIKNLLIQIKGMEEV